MKTYLGDSVYADFNGAVVLTTENGLPTDPSNVIVLEAEVIAAFEAFLQRLRDDFSRPEGGAK